MEIPETRYAKTVDGVHIAFQVIGDGPTDLVFVSWLLNVDHVWTWPGSAAFLRRLATFSRLIILDRRGTGLSDHALDLDRTLPLESRMDDIRAVMDAAGSERAVILGIEDGFAVASMFSATYPERTVGLVAYGAAARTTWAPDYPIGTSEEEYAEGFDEVDRLWGTRELARIWMPFVLPDSIGDEGEVDAFASWMRSGGGPGDAVSWLVVDRDTDVREVLPAVRVPTLVIHRVGDRSIEIEHGRYIAEHIPGAKLVELPGAMHGWPGADDFADAVRDFLEDLRREEAEFDRVLATVLFTDIVGSTQKAGELGDAAWKSLLERHHAAVRAMIGRYRGTEVDTAGDGFLATFDGPARGVRCAQAITEAVEKLGIEIRAGLHTGEVETIDGKVGGIAVHIGARVGALAGPSEVLVSSTVKDLVAGSGLLFEDRGVHELKGVPDPWHIYAVAASS